MKRDPTIRKYIEKRNLKALEEYDFKALRGKPSSSHAPAPVVRIVQKSCTSPKRDSDLLPDAGWMA